jgi:hypothetical protein
MLYTSFYFRLFLLLCLSSCAAALVPETSDPNEKLKQSYELVSSKRGIAAEKVINQAMQMFQSKENKEGMARAYYAYALLYRSNASHHSLKLPDNYRAGEAYKKAADLYGQLGNREHEVDTLILAAMFYSVGEGKVGVGSLGCRTLLSAERIPNALKSRVVEVQKKMKCL